MMWPVKRYEQQGLMLRAAWQTLYQQAGQRAVGQEHGQMQMEMQMRIRLQKAGFSEAFAMGFWPAKRTFKHLLSLQRPLGCFAYTLGG
jgi:hypothetical protein